MTIYLVFWMLLLGLAPFIKSNRTQIAFCVFVFIFVGLRYETGFDWPTYKRAFDILSIDFSINSILAYSEAFKVEIGWLVVTGLVGQIFPEYEFLQAIVTLAFLGSTFKLCRALGVKNVAMAVAIASSFLLLTLLFSTTRQCFAVSIFNLAVAAAAKRRWTLMVALSAFAVSIHTSTVLYIVAMVYAVARPSKLPSTVMVATMLALSTIFVLLIPIVADSLPEILASRVIWYNLDQSPGIIGLWKIYFLILAAFILVYTLFIGPAHHNYDHVSTFHRRLVVALAVMCMGTYSLDIIRDRISYELFLMFSVYLARSDLAFHVVARFGAFSLGMFFSVLNIFAPENRIVFMPYQNAVTVVLTGETGDGPARQELLHRDFERR